MQQDFPLRVRQRGILEIAALLREYNVFPGLRQTANIGWGFDIADIRDFEPGDDPQDIDIDILRRGERNVVEFQSLEEAPIVVFVDISSSMMDYPENPEYSKVFIRDIAAGLVIFSALNAMMPVGLVLFSDEIRQVFDPIAGEYANYLFESLLVQKSGSGEGTSIFRALQYARRFPETIICLISDFQDRTFIENDAEWRSNFLGLDVVPIVIRDPFESVDFRGDAYFLCRDPETGKEAPVHITERRYAELREESERFYGRLYENFDHLRIPCVSLDSTDVDECYDRLRRFFARREVMGLR